MGYGQKINKAATLVSVNLDTTALTKNRKPTHAVNAHPGHFLVQLAEAAPQTGDLTSWFGTLREREDARDAEIRAKASDQGPRIDPIHLFLRIEEKMSDDSIVIVDGGASWPRAPTSCGPGALVLA